MYKSRTTLIIGAGASLELGFPTSATLKEKIASAVNVRFEHYRQTDGHPAIGEGLRQVYNYNDSTQTDEYNAHLAAGWHISKAMPQSISIDNFVENQEDDRVTLMAKLGITSCLIDSELSCLNHFRKADAEGEIKWDIFQDNWIHSFFQTLTEGTRKSQIERIFENLKFVVFNYDRSLEFFLSHCLANYYQMDYKSACEIVGAADFIHPYGQIGRLQWQHSDLPILPFGSGKKNDIHLISRSILTFSEQLEDTLRLESLRSAVEDAEQLVFLGFAYHDSNMQLLQPKRKRDTRRAIGTAYGVSEPDANVILDQVTKLCLIDKYRETFARSGMANEQISINVILDRNATCKNLFEKYRRVLVT